MWLMVVTEAGRAEDALDVSYNISRSNYRLGVSLRHEVYHSTLILLSILNFETYHYKHCLKFDNQSYLCPLPGELNALDDAINFPEVLSRVALSS